MKAILETLFSFFKWIFSDFKHIAIIILMCLSLVLLFKYHKATSALDRVNHELIEATDSISVYKNKTGELYSEVETYIADNKELKKLNTELYDEYKKLKDHPTVIVKTETITQIDSITIKDTVTVISDNLFESAFNYNDKWCSIDGYTKFNYAELSSYTTLNSIKFNASLTTDLIERKGQLYFITKSDNPYVQINNIEGVVISPEQSKVLSKQYNKPWVLTFGIGPSITVVDNTVKLYPALQLTLGYKILDFKL